MNNKQYLISFLATIQGDKLVVRGLRRVEQTTKGVEARTKKLGKANKGLASQFTRLALRATIVIPIWLALRSIYTGIISTTRDMIKANLDLEEGLARIRTVVSASSKTVEADMGLIRKTILDMATTTRAPIKDLAEAFYFLRTSNLDTSEALDAFEAVVNISVGTINNMKDSARALAGIYNTMGEAIGNNLNPHEKFQRIADLLTFTYATQDVQLQELTESYTKFAPYVSGLGDSFAEIITTLGFLNTRLLRAGRTGRLTGRAILQLTKNSDKLADIFGITFDPNQPIRFLDVIRQVSNQVREAGGLTAEQGQRIQEVFATRAGVAIRLLIHDFDDLQEQIRRANEEAEGFAERMRKIREETTRAQLGRFKNILAVLSNEFIHASLSGENFGSILKIINDDLADSRDNFREAGLEIAFYLENMKLLVRVLAEVQTQQSGVNTAIQGIRGTMGMGITGGLFPVATLGGATGNAFRIIRILKQGMDLFIEKVGKSREDIRKATEEILKQREEDLKKIKQTIQAQKEEAEVEQKRQLTNKEINQLIQHQVALRKLAGQSEEEILRYRREALDLFRLTTVEEEFKLQELLNKEVETELTLRKDIKDRYLEASIGLLKTLGASELEILDYQARQVELQRDILGNKQANLQLDELRLQKALAIVKAKKQEFDSIVGLYDQVVGVDELEKERLKRAIELIQLDPGDLASRYRSDIYDRRIVDEYFSHFSQAGKESINEVRAELISKILKTPIKLPEGKLELNIEEKISMSLATQFGETWERRMLEAVEKFRVKFLEAQRTVLQLSQQQLFTPPVGNFAGIQPRVRAFNRELRTVVIQLGDRNVSVTGDITEEVIELIAQKEYQKVKELLLSDQRVKNQLSREL